MFPLNFCGLCAQNVKMLFFLKKLTNEVQMTLKWYFFEEIAKIANRLGAKPPDPRLQYT